jgi:hypothetical protein
VSRETWKRAFIVPDGRSKLCTIASADVEPEEQDRELFNKEAVAHYKAIAMHTPDRYSKV